MEYKVGDKIRIVKPQNKHWDTKIDHFIGKVMTIKEITDDRYLMEEDVNEYFDLGGWFWREEDFSELVSSKEEIQGAGIIRRIDDRGRVAIPNEIRS